MHAKYDRTRENRNAEQHISEVDELRHLVGSKTVFKVLAVEEATYEKDWAGFPN